MSDLISREAVLREFTCLSDDAFVINSTIQKIVMKLPSVEPERKTGKWKKDRKSLWPIANCSVCGHKYIGADGSNYCPNCGAKMEVGG